MEASSSLSQGQAQNSLLVKYSRKRHQSQVPHDSEPVRKSRRLQEKQPETISVGDLAARQSKLPRKRRDPRTPLPLPSISSVLPRSPPKLPVPLLYPSTPGRKPKHAQDHQVSPHHNQSRQGRESKERTPDRAEGSRDLEASEPVNPIEFWINNYTWPPSYSDPDFEMSQPLTRKRSFSNRSVDTTSSQDTPKDVPREVKSAPYKDIRCETLLAKKGSFMGAAPQKTNDAGRHLCKQLLENEQPVPNDSLFRDDIFEKTCDTIRSENEARVILDIMRLIVPSAENLANDGATKLEILKEKVNSSWLQCLPLIDTSPQPDYSVGFREAAFTEDQINKLSPFIGKDSDQSSVMARFDMYFPFLTCEVKCGAEALSIADRQNMHSASVSVKGIVELFRRLGWQQKLHREILAFSVSHDNKSVSIYGHYPLIDGDKTSFYRHPVREFNIRDQDGKEKWTAYKFTRNVYETFVPIHQKRLCSAIDQLPARYDFDVDPSLNFASQPQRGDGDETESNLSSSQNTDSIANTEHTSRSSALTFKKPTPLRR